jgi:hypothetical protein
LQLRGVGLLHLAGKFTNLNKNWALTKTSKFPANQDRSITDFFAGTVVAEIKKMGQIFETAIPPFFSRPPK